MARKCSSSDYPKFKSSLNCFLELASSKISLCVLKGEHFQYTQCSFNLMIIVIIPLSEKPIPEFPERWGN